MTTTMIPISALTHAQTITLPPPLPNPQNYSTGSSSTDNGTRLFRQVDDLRRSQISGGHTATTTCAFLRPHVPFKLASFNVRTLMHSGQQAALHQTLQSLNIDVCCLSETRIQDPSVVHYLTCPNPSTTETFRMRVSGDPVAEAAGLAGVGIALSHRAESALIDWIPINSRLCAVRLEGSSRVSKLLNTKRSLFVIAAYAPTDCSSDSVKDEFYRQLHDLLRNVAKSDIVVLAGDLNARVGRLTTTESHLGGHHGLDSCRTDNGERLLQICSDHKLYLSSVSFRNKKSHKATWRPPSSRQRWTQIDHIAISYRWRGCVKSCRSYWNTFVDSDHALVCANLQLRFGGRPHRRPNQIDVAKLNIPEVAEVFQREISALLPISSVVSTHDYWAQLQQVLHETALRVCGVTKRRSEPWISTRSLELLNERRTLPPGPQMDAKRQSIRREIQTSMKKDRELWWTKQATLMEAAALSGNTRKLFQLINSTGGKRLRVSETIKEVDGTIIINRSKRLDRWADYFQSQLNWPSGSDQQPAVSVSEMWDIPTHPPSEAEVSEALSNMKYNKSPGLDGLPAEVFRAAGYALVVELTRLLSEVWETESVPLTWSDSVIIPVFKKGSRNECSNYRGISLIPIASKLLVTIILHRLSQRRNLQTREEQAGFRPGRGCVDQIFALRQLLEHRHIYRRPTIVVFLDIRGAFDAIDRASLWDCLNRFGVPLKYVKLLEALYSQTTSRVRVYGELSNTFSVSSGVRQGCPISPFLFNFAIDDILQSVFASLPDNGVELYPGNKVTDLVYADDIALMGFDPTTVQLALDRLAVEARRYGLCFAPNKCKILLQDWQGIPPVFSLSGEPVEVVDKFVYLGSVISAGGSVEIEVTTRIAKARLAFTNLNHLWRRRDISLSLKGRVYSATVRAVLVYGCEAWPLRVEDMRKLSVFDHRCLRRISHTSWQHKVSNSDVRQRVFGNINCKSIEEVISLHRLRWLGHVLRMPATRLPKRCLFALSGPGWKKIRGGQPMTWRRGMKTMTAGLAAVGSSRLPGWGPRDSESVWLHTLEDMARNRSQWRSCCVSLCPSSTPSQN
ncbi:MAG: reverse transcriptase domain-containing protein [Candidatus Thiodiazotropha sp.]